EVLSLGRAAELEKLLVEEPFRLVMRGELLELLGVSLREDLGLGHDPLSEPLERRLMLAPVVLGRLVLAGRVNAERFRAARAAELLIDARERLGRLVRPVARRLEEPLELRRRHLLHSEIMELAADLADLVPRLVGEFPEALHIGRVRERFELRDRDVREPVERAN